MRRVRGTSVPWWRVEREGLTMPVRVDPTGRGGPTKRQARGPRWRTTSRGLHVPITVDDGSVDQRIVEAAAVLPKAAEFSCDPGVTGWASLRWSGGFWFGGLGPDGATRLPVTLAVGDSTIVAQPGIEISEEHLRPDDMKLVDGLPTTTHARSVTYLMRHATTLAEAVTALDMAAYNDLVSIREVRRYLPSLATWTGIPQCRRAVDLSEENAWSPREVVMRMIWTSVAELPHLWCNRPVFDRFGHHLGTPDLLDEEAGVALEYDGSAHLVGHQHRKDRDREESFRRVGLEYFTMLGGDHDHDQVAARMHEVRARARWQAPSTRAWTTELPSWWIPTFTVDQRRDLDPGLRLRCLRYRRTA